MLKGFYPLKNEESMKRTSCKIRHKKLFDIEPGHPMYCCQQWIDYWVNEPRVPISYDPALRLYYMLCDDSTNWIKAVRQCTVCKKTFPDDVYSQREAILEKEYGISEIEEMRHPEIVPEEFKSEEWWKKRGL